MSDATNDTKATGIMFKREITPGNVVSWLLIVGGFVYGYSQLNGKVDNIVASIARMENTDAALQAQINVIRDLSTARQIDISTKMTRLETILERQEGKLDRNLLLGPPQTSRQ